MYDNEWDGSSVQSRSIDRDVRSVASTDFDKIDASRPSMGGGRTQGNKQCRGRSFIHFYLHG